MSDRWSVEGLRYAEAVAKAGSFSAAARAYGVTQPALSNGIAKLESRLGERLFDRSARGVVPTSFGAQMLPLIQRATAALDDIPAQAKRWNAPGGEDIRMGVSPLIDPGLVARAYTAVCCLGALPGPHQLVLREASVADLRAALSAGDLDLILIPSVAPMPRYEHRVVASEPVVVVEPAPAGRGPVELHELIDKPLILLPDTCGLTTFVRDLFQSHDLPLRAYPGEASTHRVLEEWANLGLGTAVLPRSKVTSPATLHRALVEDGAEIEIFYEAVWNPNSALAPELRRLAETLVERPASAAQG